MGKAMRIEPIETPKGLIWVQVSTERVVGEESDLEPIGAGERLRGWTDALIENALELVTSMFAAGVARVATVAHAPSEMEVTVNLAFHAKGLIVIEGQGGLQVKLKWTRPTHAD